MNQFKVTETTTMKKHVLSKKRKPALSTAYTNLSQNANHELENCYSMETKASKVIRESDCAVIKLETTVSLVFVIYQNIS